MSCYSFFDLCSSLLQHNSSNVFYTNTSYRISIDSVWQRHELRGDVCCVELTQDVNTFVSTLVEEDQRFLTSNAITSMDGDIKIEMSVIMNLRNGDVRRAWQWECITTNLRIPFRKFMS